MAAHATQREKLICTECGWPRVTRKPAWWGRPWVVAAVLTLGLFCYAATTVRGVRGSSGSESPRFVEPGVSASEAMSVLADPSDLGDARASEIVRSILEASELDPRMLTLGPTVIHAAFGPAAAPVDESWSFGWPAAWVTGKSTIVYEDAMNRIGPKVAKTDPRGRPARQYEDAPNPLQAPPRRMVEMWGLDVVISPPPEDTNGVLRRWHVRLAGLALTAAMCVGVWVGAGMVGRRRVRRTQVCSVLAFVGASVIIAVAGFDAESRLGVPRWIRQTQQAFPPATIYWQCAPCVDLGLTSADIERLLGQPEGAKQVLARLVETAPVDGPPESAFLGLALYPTAWLKPQTATTTSWSVNVGLPIGSYGSFQFTRHPLAGESDPFVTMPAIVTMWRFGNFIVRQDRGALPSRSIGIAVESLAMIGLAIWGILLLYRRAMDVRPVVRRRRGLCPQCAYPLQEERAASPADAVSERGSASEGTG